MKIGRLLLRLAVGGFFIGHGTQKLFGWFGGYGLEGTAQGFESLGLRPGKRHALAAGTAEAGGGALIALGAATPVAASVLTATMLTAINRAHLKNGPWATNGGYEYNVVLIAAVLALAETGPGSPSVDAALGSERYGPKWAAWALLAGVAGAATAHAIAEATDAPEPPAEPETESQGEAAHAEETTPA
jgi:putative oxidoreductase